MSVTEKAMKGWQRWRLFRELEPGHRFQTRYHNHRERRERGETSRYGRLLNLVGGSALIVAGFAFLPTPGPSYIIIGVGLWTPLDRRPLDSDFLRCESPGRRGDPDLRRRPGVLALLGLETGS
jgi:hypothetical protein